MRMIVLWFNIFPNFLFVLQAMLKKSIEIGAVFTKTERNNEWNNFFFLIVCWMLKEMDSSEFLIGWRVKRKMHL